MNSRQCKALLLDYLEGELSAHQRAEVEAALAQYPDCQAELDALRATRELVVAAPLPGDGPTEPYWDAFETRVLAHTREVRPQRRRLAPWLAPLALAAVTAAIVLAVNAFTPTVAPQRSGEDTTYVVNVSGIEDAALFAASSDMDWADPAEIAASLDADMLDTAPAYFVEASPWMAEVTPDDFAGQVDWYTELESLDSNGLDALLERLDAVAS